MDKKKTIYIHKGHEVFLTGRTASRQSYELAKFGLEAPMDHIVEVQFRDTVRTEWVVKHELYELDT